MTYKQFIAHARAQQTAYIASERKRYTKARKLRERYEAAMRGLGLHPLDRLEIEDRFAQLDGMMAEYRDTPAMRGVWEMQERSAGR